MGYKFLIFLSFRYSIPIALPIERELQKRNLNFKWFVDEKETLKFIPKDKPLLLTTSEVKTFNPDVILVISNTVPYFFSGIKVQIFHGFNAEKRPSNKGHFRIRGFFDLYCTHGPSTTKIFKKIQTEKSHFEVVETGWPKMDPLFPLVTKKKIENEIPLVMIASTFTPSLSLAYNEELYDEIKRLSRSNFYIFKMVMHPKMDREVVMKWKKLESKNFEFIDTVDLIPLFKESDLLLADTTSVIYEYLLQKKPVVAFNHTKKHDFLINFSNPHELKQKLDFGLKYPNKIIDKIKLIISDLHPYYDGKSSARVIDASINFIETDHNLKQKPLNIFRKIKIRLKYISM